MWLKAARAPFLVASAVPVLFGAAFAWRFAGVFDLSIFIATFVGIVLMHAAANMTNEYFDYKNKTDVVNKNRTIFSGGSGLLVEGKMTQEQYRKGFAILYLIVLACCLFIFHRLGNKGWILLLLALSGFLLTYFYSSPPVNLAHRGLGEITVGLCFGVLPIMGTYFAITGRLSFKAVLVSLPITMLIAAVLYINQYPDVEADTYAEKKNLVVRLGRGKSRIGYHLMMAGTYLSILLLVSFGILPIYSLFALLTAPIAFKASKILHKNYQSPKDVFPAMGLTILNHHLTGLILTGSLFLGSIL